MTHFAYLEGARIVAGDGTFLGIVTRSSVHPLSISNVVGPYGGTVSPTSIFTIVGPYGSQVAPMSPFNPVTTIPPRILKQDSLMGYLTVNVLITPRIDPYELAGWLRAED